MTGANAVSKVWDSRLGCHQADSRGRLSHK
jgi:hypothetical protein